MMAFTNKRGAKTRRGFWRDAGGIAATEFALIAPVFVIMTLGIIDVGNALFEKFSLDSAARVGAEYALKNSDDVAGIRDAVLKSANLDESLVNVESQVFCECGFQQANACDATCPDNSALQKYVKVSVSSFYNPIFLPNPEQPETDQFTFFQDITQLTAEVTLRLQ